MWQYVRFSNDLKKSSAPSGISMGPAGVPNPEDSPEDLALKGPRLLTMVSYSVGQRIRIEQNAPNAKNNRTL